jgi:hypothetical protein
MGDATALPERLQQRQGSWNLERSRLPRLSNMWKDPEQAKKLNLHLRGHLVDCFVSVSKGDPSERSETLRHNEGFIKAARQLQVHADEIIFKYRNVYNTTLPTFGRGLDKDSYSHRYEVVRLTEKFLLGLSSRLSEMIGWAYDELDDIAPPLGGRPRLSWRYDFIAVLADLWRLVTDHEPSYKPNGLFTQFVEAAWQSGGDDMPEVPWDSVVPRYSRDGKESGGKTSPSGN